MCMQVRCTPRAETQSLLHPEVSLGSNMKSYLSVFGITVTTPHVAQTQNLYMRRSKILCAGAVGTALLTSANPGQAFAAQPALKVKTYLPKVAASYAARSFGTRQEGCSYKVSIHSLHRYPVKSCLGEEIPRAEIVQAQEPAELSGDYFCTIPCVWEP